MDISTRSFDTVRRFFATGLTAVEYIGLLAVAFATTAAMSHEIWVMYSAQYVQLTDLLLMFLFLEVLAMIGHYFKSGQLPVRFPLYIAMVALARYMILDLKEMSEWRILIVSSAIFIITAAVLLVRLGHVRYPYADDASETPKAQA